MMFNKKRLFDFLPIAPEEYLSSIVSQVHNPAIRSADGTPLLVAATQSNRITLVHQLLKLGAPVNDCDRNGSTAHMIAAREGHLPILNCLIKHGANMDLVNSFGYTGLSWAVKWSQFHAVKQLWGVTSNRNQLDQDGLSLMEIALRYSGVEMAVFLLELPGFRGEATMAALEAMGKFGAYHNNVFLLKTALDLGLSPNLRLKFGLALLSITIIRKALNCTQLLLDRGGDLEAQDEFKRSPLSIAKAMREAEILFQ